MKPVRLASLLVALAFVLLAAPALAKVERFAVFIGNDAGQPGDVQLRYAESDAARMSDVLKDLGGFPPQNITLLRGEDVDVVRQAIIAMNDRVRQAIAAPDTQVILLVYYSGHADAVALHLGKTRFDLAELEQLVRGSAATFRVMILDACRSGALTRVKGGTAAPPIPIRLESRVAGQGVVFLTSNSANEDAQESDALKGSFFTHYLVSGLLGAADEDGDGLVALDEAYHHAYENTLRATSRTFAGTQHPTFRYELRGQGKVVLTAMRTPGSKRGVIELPPRRGYLLMAGGSNGTVVAEVSERDIARKISVKAGSYFVRGRGPDDLVEGTIQVSAGETSIARDELFTRSAYARLVRKGGAPNRFAQGPEAGYRMRTELSPGGGLCHGFFVGWTFEAEHLSFVPRLGACRAGYENASLSAHQDQIDGSVRLAHAFDLPGVTLDIGVSLGGGVFHQSFTTRGVAPDRTSAFANVGAGVGLSVELGRGLFALAEIDAETYFFRETDPARPGDPIVAAFAARPLGGLGKHF